MYTCSFARTPVPSCVRVKSLESTLSSGISSGSSGSAVRSAHPLGASTDLRLLRGVLKERDDLVLSYHTALTELSKLAAGMKEENQLLRAQLDVTELSHSDVVHALTEQVRNYNNNNGLSQSSLSLRFFCISVFFSTHSRLYSISCC